jgi:hypothetical protein
VGGAGSEEAGVSCETAVRGDIGLDTVTPRSSEPAGKFVGIPPGQGFT